MEKQTGRDTLTDFAPKFAQLNDDVLFGEVGSREERLSLKARSGRRPRPWSARGMADSSLTYPLAAARKNGVTRTEMAELLTHLALYVGWPNAFAQWAGKASRREVAAVNCIAKRRET